MINETPVALPQTSPAASGVSARSVERFVAAWEELASSGRSEPHSFMLLRHGNLIAEGWWHPYRPEAVQNVYSVSKTYASLAIGFAIKEGLLELDDSVVGFFPDKLPDAVPPNLAAMTVRHLLSMTTGHTDNMTWPMMMQPDWVVAFLALPVPDEPGTHFVYDSSASYMLSAIVQSVSGLKLIDYLESRLFEPLGAHGQRWAECPRGRNTGGWGLSVTTETLAKTGQLFLQRGVWNDVHLLPAEWMETASALHVQQEADWVFAGVPDPDVSIDQLRQDSDYYQGYGLHMWRGREGSYRGDGALAQFMIVLPEHDAVLALTSESPDWQGLLDVVWRTLLPAFDSINEEEGDDGVPLRLLRELPRPAGSKSSTEAQRIHGAAYALEPNTLEADSIAFTFDRDEAHVTLVRNGGVSSLHASTLGWRDGTTNMPGTPPDLFSDPTSAVESSVSTSAAWLDEKTLVLAARFFETPHGDMLTCTFEGDAVEIRFMNSLAVAFGATDPAHPFAERRPVLRGLRQ